MARLESLTLRTRPSNKWPFWAAEPYRPAKLIAVWRGVYPMVSKTISC
jgi:hypothetical protein